MSEDIVEKAFVSAIAEVDNAHRVAVEDASAKVEDAKAEALKKISP